MLLGGPGYGPSVRITRKAAVSVAMAGALLLVAGCGQDAPLAASPSPSVTTPFVVPESPQVPTPTPTPTTNALLAFQKQPIDWSDCGGGNECADMKVPLDYQKPEGRTILLSLLRNPASGPGKKLGAIVVNPGGPGGSGINYAASESVFSAKVSSRYDVVGFDPRGVGKSAPVRCLTPREADKFYAFDGSPDSDAEATASFLLGKRFANLCTRSDGDLLPYLGTRESAQDLEVLRGVLRQQRLNYLGKSYGTFLGTEYARQFPDKVGRLVLDGAIDPALNADDYARGQALGFQRALDAFAADCVRRSGCPLGRDVNTGQDTLNAYLDRLDREPQQVGDRQLTQALGTLGVLASFYSKSSWATLRGALTKAFAGDGSELLRLADFYSDREPSGKYSNNGLDAFYSISCMDRADSKSVSATRAFGDTLTEEVSQTFGAYIAWGNTPCQSWNVPPTLTPAAASAPGSNPIIVIGTTRDPATPYEWSVGLAKQLESGTLITYDGDGHTAYGYGSACVNDAVDRFYLTGKPPTSDLSC